MKTRILLMLAAILAMMNGMAQTAYVTNEGDSSVTVIDVTTNAVITTIPVGLYPYAISVSRDGNKVYIANRNPKTISVINTSTNTVSATIMVGGSLNAICINLDGTKLYATNSLDSTIVVINTITNTIIDTIIVGASPDAIVVSPDGSKIYVANFRATRLRMPFGRRRRHCYALHHQCWMEWCHFQFRMTAIYSLISKDCPFLFS